jgi:hypothetical protein
LQLSASMRPNYVTVTTRTHTCGHRAFRRRVCESCAVTTRHTLHASIIVKVSGRSILMRGSRHSCGQARFLNQRSTKTARCSCAALDMVAWLQASPLSQLLVPHVLLLCTSFPMHGRVQTAVQHIASLTPSFLPLPVGVKPLLVRETTLAIMTV